MPSVHFALIREGTSDDGLVRHIRDLLVRAGFEDVIGAPRQYKGTVAERLVTVLSEGAVPELIFVHRDADAADPVPRCREIHDAAASLDCTDRVVSVVPVQELEAWLLTDQAAIRSVVGRPNGRTPLSVPRVARLEATSSPKEVLRSACIDASETSGARRKKEAARFSTRRASLLEQLDIDGPVSQLPSWQCFVTDLNAAAARLLAGAIGP